MRQLLVSQGKRYCEPAVLTLFRTHAEIDKVLPVRRRQQEGRGHAEFRKECVGFSLGVEVGDFVIVHQRGHPVVVQGHPFSGVFKRGPDDVFQVRCFRRLGHAPRVSQFFFRREMLPEKSDAERAVGTGKARVDAARIVHVHTHDFRAQRGKCFRLVGRDVSGESPRGEITIGVVENSPYQASTLSPRST